MVNNWVRGHSFNFNMKIRQKYLVPSQADLPACLKDRGHCSFFSYVFL